MSTVARRFVPANARRLAAEATVVWVAAAIDLVAWSGDDDLRGGGAVPFLVVPIATVLVYPALLWRERAPVAVFGVFWLHALSGVVLPRYLPIAALLVALHTVAVRRPLRTSAVAGLSCLVPFLLDAVNAADHTVDGGTVAVVTALWILSVLAACAWFLGRRSYLATRRRELDHRAHEAAVAHTIRSERLSLARDLHDTIANAVNAMVLHAAGTRAVADGSLDDLTRALGTIEHTGIVAMEELRRLLLVLREPSGAAEVPTAGLRDLDGLVSEARRAGHSVTVETVGPRPTLDRGVDLVAFRVVQEGLANAAKHAPGSAVDVTVSVDDLSGAVPGGGADEHLVITVVNVSPEARPPRRTHAPSTGMGLIGLSERVGLVGGVLRAGRASGGLFLLEVRLPTRPGGRTASSSASPGPATARP